MAKIYYPPPGFYFKLTFSEVSNKDDINFKEASGLEVEVSTEELKVGGENRFQYKLPNPPKYNNLVLKRGLARNNSQIAKWVRTTMSSGFSEALQLKTVTLMLLEASGNPLISWNFFDCYPVKWSASDFNSMENNLVIENLELAYTYFKPSFS